ncbi:MAG: 50S ribosomal protein L7/L12 [Candidatus Omnitrophica bacterium]|nr:50S ribosomal protein L7/L12 [Candidatus Omnitrophota bacterium]
MTEVKEKKKEETAEESKEQEKKEIKLSKKAEEIVGAVEKLSVLELSNLVKALEDKFGVSAQAVQVAAAGAPAGGAAGAPEEEKTSFDVILASIGDKKIQVIKEIRVITKLGLKEAKDLVDQAPKPVKEGATKEEAEQIKKQLEAQGASVEIK